MPFLKLDEFEAQPPERDWYPPGSREPEVLLRQIGPNAFQLMEGFRYLVPPGTSEPWVVPQHNFCLGPSEGDNSTDLASVPRYLWWFIGSYGSHTRAALLHDYLVDLPNAVIKRREADRVFRVALMESDVGFLRRWFVWTAVSLATWWQSGLGWLRLAVVAFAVHFTALTVSTAYWLLGGDWWWLGNWSWLEEHPWTPALALLVLGFPLWKARWPSTILAVVLLFVPTVAAVFASALVDALDWVFARLGWIKRRLFGEDDQAPFMGPRVGAHPHEPGPF